MNLHKFFLFSLSLLALSACGGQATAQVTSSASEKEKDARGFEVLRFNDIVDGKETYFSQFPASYKLASKKQGTVIRLDYTTDRYENDTVYQKHLNVYLPYGYDQNDTAKKYNVIYMQHGGGRSEDDLVTPGKVTTFQNELDNLFDPDMGGDTPVIMVFPTFNLDKETGLNGNVMQNRVAVNYHLEVIHDIIPLVESRYNTYYTGSSEDELIATRDHRAFTGYSAGGACTWYMSIKAFPYFRYFMPMSATSIGAEPTARGTTDTRATDLEGNWAQHKAAIDAHPELPYFFYVSSGVKENNGPAPHDFVNYLSKQTDYFTFARDPKVKKGLFYSVSRFPHTDEMSPYYIDNALSVVFRD